MELEDLKKMWIQYDIKLSENTRLNKEILKRMLVSKTEKRLSWIKIKEGFKLILPIVMILIIVPKVHYRASIDFYVGVSLFGILGSLSYFWAVRYFMRIRKIDFTNSITLIKKDLNELEKYKIKITRFNYVFMPFAAVGIFMIAEIPFLSKNFLLPLSLIILIMIISIYYTFKYSIFERYKKLNIEINEIEQLEKE
jgi:hypothetical protein